MCIRDRALKIPVIRADDVSPVAKLPYKAEVLFQVGLRRALELTESCIREANSMAFAPLYVDARALLETVAVVAEMGERIKRIVGNWDRTALTDLDTQHMKALLGSRKSGWGDPAKVPARNILSVIDDLSKALDQDIRAAYDDLSEHAHPNFAGMQGAYQRIEAENRRSLLIEHPLLDGVGDIGHPLAAIAVSLALLTRAFGQYRRLSYEFTRLCEEDIHQAGTWPQGLVYPLHPPRP